MYSGTPNELYSNCLPPNARKAMNISAIALPEETPWYQRLWSDSTAALGGRFASGPIHAGASVSQKAFPVTKILML